MQKFLSAISLLLLLFIHAGDAAGKSPVQILILGDSLSAAHNIPIEKSWPRLFSHNIGAKFPQSRVINSSISGETTFGGRNRLPRLLDQHAPTLLIIELGGNDALRGLDFNQTSANLMQMAAMAKSRGIDVLLIGVRMPPNYGAAYSARFQAIYAQVSDRQGIHYLPRFLEGIAASGPGLMQADGIHPTVTAQPMLARKVADRVSQILGPSPIQ